VDPFALVLLGGLVALILSIVIIGFVAFLAVTRKDVDEDEAGRGRRSTPATAGRPATLG